MTDPRTILADILARVSSPYLTRDEAADYLRVSVDTIDHQQVDAARARGRVGVTARPAVPVVVVERSVRPGFRVRAGGPRASGRPGALSFHHGRTA